MPQTCRKQGWEHWSHYSFSFKCILIHTCFKSEKEEPWVRYQWKHNGIIHTKTPSGKWQRCLWEYGDRESARDWFCGFHTWLWALISSTAQFQVKEAKAVLGRCLTWVLRAGSQNGVQWHFLGQQELTLFLNSERPVREDKGYLPSNA